MFPGSVREATSEKSYQHGYLNKISKKNHTMLDMLTWKQEISQDSSTSQRNVSRDEFRVAFLMPSGQTFNHLNELSSIYMYMCR